MSQEPAFSLSAPAAARIRELAANGQRLRITVLGGGCSGFQYSMALDTAQNEDDRIFGENGAEVVIDTVSLDLLKGAELQYTDDLMAASFSIKNPNAASSCGCGNSFSV